MKLEITLSQLKNQNTSDVNTTELSGSSWVFLVPYLPKRH